MSNRLAWNVDDSSAVTHTTLVGPVDEDSDFALLLKELKVIRMFALT